MRMSLKIIDNFTIFNYMVNNVNIEIILIFLLLITSVVYTFFYFYKALSDKEDKICSKCIESKTNFKKKV